MQDVSRPKGLYMNVTTWRATENALLDHISYLEDCRQRAGDYLTECVKNGLAPAFEMAEAVLILWESRDESERRRWAQKEEQYD